ncbi:hypothetical protein NBRC116494_30510 [Aurantivibrio plasticivorans]
MNKREQNKQRVRQRILSTCGSLFRKYGFDETTLPSILEAADISRQTFFNYFPSKEAVLRELGLMWLRQQAQIPREGAARAQSSGIIAGMRRAIQGQLQAIEGDMEFMRLVFTRSGLLSPNQLSVKNDTEQRDHTRAVLLAVSSVFEKAQSTGEVGAQHDPTQLSEILIGTMLMTIRLWLLDYWDQEQSLEERGLQAFDILIQGVTQGSE